jgi:hypothetical protein
MTSALAAYSYVLVKYAFIPCSHMLWTVWSSCVSVRCYHFIPNVVRLLFLFSAWRVQPRNYLLFACHFTNATAQLTQGYRFVNYWHGGGKEKKALYDAPSTDATKGRVTEAVKAAQAASPSSK